MTRSSIRHSTVCMGLRVLDFSIASQDQNATPACRSTTRSVPENNALALRGPRFHRLDENATMGSFRGRPSRSAPMAGEAAHVVCLAAPPVAVAALLIDMP